MPERLTYEDFQNKALLDLLKYPFNHKKILSNSCKLGTYSLLKRSYPYIVYRVTYPCPFTTVILFFTDVNFSREIAEVMSYIYENFKNIAVLVCMEYRVGHGIAVPLQTL